VQGLSPSPISQTPGASPASGTLGTGSHHHHGGLFKQIENAVASALQQSPTSATTDPNTTIQNAIASVLKNALNGTSSGDSDSDGDSNNPLANILNPNTPTSAQQGFATALKAANVTPQEFQNDFAAAVQSLQSDSSSNGSALIQSLPPGLLVDTTA
jgi:hypothetical protein